MLVLDLFCGVGGAGEGYRRGGFNVVGVDINPQPHYPFQFIHADALELLQLSIDSGKIKAFDLIHASPPCQTFSWGARKGRQEKFPDLLGPTRELLIESGLPYVIENIPNAPINGMQLCGLMFDLPLLKHRVFETNFPMAVPYHPRHVHGGVQKGLYLTVAGHGGNNKSGNYGVQAWRDAMDLQWATTRHELAEAIPPAYTEYVGRSFLRTRRPGVLDSPDG